MPEPLSLANGGMAAAYSAKRLWLWTANIADLLGVVAMIVDTSVGRGDGPEVQPPGPQRKDLGRMARCFVQKTPPRVFLNRK